MCYRDFIRLNHRCLGTWWSIFLTQVFLLRTQLLWGPHIYSRVTQRVWHAEDIRGTLANGLPGQKWKLSSQAKRKSIYTGGKANEVPVSEVVSSGKCSKEDRRSSTVARACSITTEFVTQFATDISTTPGSSQLYLRDLCLQHEVCSVQVWNTMPQRFTLWSCWCIGTPTYKTAEKLLHYMFRNSSFSIHSTWFELNKQLINPEKTKTSWVSDDDKTFHSKNVSYTAKLDKKLSPIGFVSNFLGYFW